MGSSTIKKLCSIILGTIAVNTQAQSETLNVDGPITAASITLGNQKQLFLQGGITYTKINALRNAPLYFNAGAYFFMNNNDTTIKLDEKLLTVKKSARINENLNVTKDIECMNLNITDALKIGENTGGSIEIKSENKGLNWEIKSVGVYSTPPKPCSINLVTDSFNVKKGDVSIEKNLKINGTTTIDSSLYVNGPYFALQNPNSVFTIGVGNGPCLNITHEQNGNIYKQIITTEYGCGFSCRDTSPLEFIATNYTFKSGDMKVEGSIECQKEMRVTQIDAKDIRTNDITVDMSNAADYVFDEDYDLKSLEDVETYVKTNKHLPGIPSASEMAQNGMSLAEMSNLLLEKVEELTLHMIELEKENKALKKQMEAMVK